MGKIIIADDQAISREGLRSMLARIPGCEVIACVRDAGELFKELINSEADLLIINPALPNLGGIQAIEKIKSSSVLILSNQNFHTPVAEAIKAGAKGYLLKTTEIEEIEFAIKSILQGLVYITPEAANLLLSKENELQSLSTREIEVLKLLTAGIPNRDVAKKLHISNRTIDSHRSNIMRKLGARSNAELVQIAIRAGLID